MNRTESNWWLRALTYIGIYGGLLTPLIFVPLVIFPFVFSKLIFFQILIGLTFPAYLIWAWQDPSVRPKWVPMYGAILAYFAAVAISVVFAIDPNRAFWGNQERMNGLFSLLHFVAWMTMTVSVIKTWEQWKKIVVFEIVLSAIMAIVAMLQKVFPTILIFPAGDRVGGLLDNPIYMAAYQIFNLFFIALLFLKGISRNTKIFLGVIAFFDLIAFILAQSRGALLGLAVGGLVFAVSYSLMGKNKKVRNIILSLLAIGCIGYGGIYAFKDTAIIRESPLERLTNFNTTTRTRFIAWEIAWQGFLERPITGWGFDDFHIVFNAKYNPESLHYSLYETWFDRSHNTVMDVLVMTGLLGFITYFSIFGTMFYSIWRAYKKEWIDASLASVFIALPIAYFVQNLFVFDHPAGFTMSYFMFALIMRATMAEFVGAKEEVVKVKELVNKAPVGLKPMPWAGLAIVYVMAFVIVWRFSWLPVRASYLSIQSNNYFGAKIYPVAFDYAKQAAEIPTPYLDEQTFLQSRNLMSMADSGDLTKFANWKEWHALIKDVTERSFADHPLSTNPLFIYARYLQSLSRFVPEDSALAEEYFKKSIETSPRRQQLYYSYGRFLIEKGRKQEGLDQYKKALEFDPELGESNWYVGLSLMYDFSKPEEGAAYIVKAFKGNWPFALTDARQAVVVAQSDAIMGDKDAMLALLEKLPSLPGGSIQIYMDIARAVEQAKMIPERDMLLRAIAQD